MAFRFEKLQTGQLAIEVASWLSLVKEGVDARKIARPPFSLWTVETPAWGLHRRHSIPVSLLLIGTAHGHNLKCSRSGFVTESPSNICYNETDKLAGMQKFKSLIN